MKNVHKNLTPIIISKAGTDVCIQDDGCTGLMLVITDKGKRTWFHRVRFNGGQIKYKLGNYPAVSIAEARLKVAADKVMVENGEDPRKTDGNTKARPSQGAANWTLDDAVERMIEHRQSGWVKRSRSAIEIRRRFRSHIYPVIPAHTKVVNITMEQCLNALLPLAKDRPAEFDKVQTVLQMALNHVSLVEPNMMGQSLYIRPGEFRKAFRKQAAKHTPKKHPYVPVTEVPAFYQHFHTIMEKNIVKRAVAPEALLFVMLTGCRTAEAIGRKADPGFPDTDAPPAPWSEIDFNSKIWTISGSRTKNGWDHLIPLSDEAITLLKRVKLKTGKAKPTDFIFPSHMPNSDGRYSDGALLSQVKKGPKYKMAYQEKGKGTIIVERHPTVHGLRTSFNTFALKAGVPPQLCSLAIAHKPDHYAQDSSIESYIAESMVEERRELMDMWAAYCTKGIKPRGWKDYTDPKLLAMYSSMKMETE